MSVVLSWTLQAECFWQHMLVECHKFFIGSARERLHGVLEEMIFRASFAEPDPTSELRRVILERAGAEQNEAWLAALVAAFDKRPRFRQVSESTSELTSIPSM